jgi:type VI secretion system protein ImpJ
LWFAPYGLAGYELDADALQNGTVSVLHARGIFPDGLAFHLPECGLLPSPRNFTDLFPPTRDSVMILLGIPDHKPGSQSCATTPEEAASARYLATARSVHDEDNGVDERRVSFGRQNLRLLIDTESTEGMVTLPLARVMRGGSGDFVFDPLFIPPCLQISASESLMLMLRRLIEILEEKSAAMSRVPGSSSFAEFSTREIASFWLLHAVNSGLVPLKHLWASKRSHPRELYLEMSRLGGSLCTFAMDSHPRDLPAYNHDRLDETFYALDRHIRRHLETIVPTNCISIPLQESTKYFYEGEITDQRCLGPSRWILAIRSKAGEVDIISRTPQLVKICSALFVPQLVRRALPGMGLTHLPSPPPAVSARVDFQYFGVDTSGPCWEHILATKRAGAYVPGDLPDPEMELLVVLES